MPRQNFDSRQLEASLQRLERVITHAELRAQGMTPATITRRIRPSGPWQRALPGVVLARPGTPTRREMLLSALAYAGEGAMVTGHDAIRAAGGRCALPSRIHVLTPAARQRSSFGAVRLERTRRLPEPVVRKGIPCAPVARATIDACRHLEVRDAVRELVAGVVQEGVCGPVDLLEELRRAARQRTALAHLVLAEVSAGVRSVAEALAREVLTAHGVPDALWNRSLLDAQGRVFLTPDAFWPEHAAALEIDSRAWHFSPADWHRTRQRQRRLTVSGIAVIAFAPTEIIDDPEGFARETSQFLQAMSRPMPPGLTYRESA